MVASCLPYSYLSAASAAGAGVPGKESPIQKYFSDHLCFAVLPDLIDGNDRWLVASKNADDEMTRSISAGINSRKR